jgi:hypothetical protein
LNISKVPTPLKLCFVIGFVALVSVPHIARADMRIAIGNDVFTELDPPIDDAGFTNDIDLHFWRPLRGYLVGGRLIHSWITERTRLPMGRRRDLVDLVATGERTYLGWLTPSARLGPTFTGNLGGRWMQNGWHTLCRCGTLLEDGLQSKYERDTAIGLLAGARVHAGYTLAYGFTPYAFVDGQLSLGTGVDTFESTTGLAFEARAGRNRFGTHGEVAALRTHVVDDRLALPGGYRPGWHGAWRVGVHFARGRIRIDYEYRANDRGSGEPFGVVAVTIKQAGHSF